MQSSFGSDSPFRIKLRAVYVVFFSYSDLLFYLLVLFVMILCMYPRDFSWKHEMIGICEDLAI